jgi:hypothetical protein|tara:strand:+ start:389 stop:640 length:252 start_codon:yes stop_codon:yes gene_type:complete
MSHANLTIHDVVNVQIKAVAYTDFTTTHLVVKDKNGDEVELHMFSDQDQFPLAGVGIDTVEQWPHKGDACNYTIAEWLARVAE